MNGVILWTSVTNEMIDGVKGFCTVTRFDFCQPVCRQAHDFFRRCDQASIDVTGYVTSILDQIPADDLAMETNNS